MICARQFRDAAGCQRWTFWAAAWRMRNFPCRRGESAGRFEDQAVVEEGGKCVNSSLLRKDLQMSPGKLAAQCCHAGAGVHSPTPSGMGQAWNPSRRAEKLRLWAKSCWRKPMKNSSMALYQNYLRGKEPQSTTESKDNYRGIGPWQIRLLPYPGCLPHRGWSRKNLMKTEKA